MLIITIALGATAYVISQLSIEKLEQESKFQTQKALKQAKQALISYAVAEAYMDDTRVGQFGFLPCPDVNDGAMAEGVQDGTCNQANKSDIGWLPNVTLGLSKQLRDSNNDCLLYAVSGAYKQSPETTHLFNNDVNGQFQAVDENLNILKGGLPEDQIVAIVFSPGIALPGQTRSFESGSNCGKDYTNIAAYLEGDGTTNNSVVTDTVDVIDQFIGATELSDKKEINAYNDQFITISRKEIWNAVFTHAGFINKMTDLTQALALCLSSYADTNNKDRRLPWPARTALADFTNTNLYIDESDVMTYGYVGRYPYKVDVSNAAVKWVGAFSPNSELFNAQGACSSVGFITGDMIDLSDVTNEYRILWEYWKDHFFYALSKGYAPDLNAGPNSCGPGNCVFVDDVVSSNYAGIVFFSNNHVNGISRSDKTIVSEYLEGDNATNFPDSNGNKIYQSTSVTGGNDIMFCITNESATPLGNPPSLTVEAC